MNVSAFIETARSQTKTNPSTLSAPSAPLLSLVEDKMAALCASTEVVGRIAAEHLDNGGKRIRARLALETCKALSVDDNSAICWAAAVELLHNATLVHDDVQDGDLYRRGRRTAWALHGVPQAINAGDLMLMLPALAIDEIGDDVGGVARAARHDLSQALFRRAVATVRGQGADLRLRAVVDECVNDGDLVAAYVSCIEGKTGELFALPVEGALLMAGHKRDEAVRLARPFFHLGVLFQLQDDVIDLFGDKGRDARGSDIREGKVSALVVEHLRLHPEDRAFLLDALDRPREATDQALVDDVIDRFDVGGAKDAVLDRIATLCTLAHHEAVPALRPLVLELIARVLAPIQHCFEHPNRSDRGADRSIRNDLTGDRHV